MQTQTDAVLRTFNHYRAFFWAYLFFIFIIHAPCNAENIIYIRTPSSNSDQYDIYVIDLLHLILDKTSDTYGSYALKNVPSSLNRLRAKNALIRGQYSQLIVEDSVNIDTSDNNQLIYVPFPVDLGILSYRVCLTNLMRANTTESIRSLSDLKNYTFLNGVGWEDGNILATNGLKTITTNSYDGFYKTIASGRADFFCLGANQIMLEYNLNKYLTSLAVEKHFYLFYSLPRLFILNKKDVILRDRISLGFERAFKDHSLQRLWAEHFCESLKFVNLNERRKLSIENNFNRTLKDTLNKYNLKLSSTLTSPGFDVCAFSNI